MWGRFSTLEGYHDACGGYHEYTRKMFSTSEGTTMHVRDIIIHVRDIMCTSGDFSTVGFSI